MIIKDDVTYFTIGEVAVKIDRTIRTIKNWYEWAEQTGNENKLPKLHQELDNKRTRFFREQDIDYLISFRDSIVRGDMAIVSRTKWGKRSPKVKN